MDLVVCGAERNQGAVVNCRFDPTLHGQGLTLYGPSRQLRVNPHRFCCSLTWVFTRPRPPLVGLDRRGFDAHAADDCGAVAICFRHPSCQPGQWRSVIQLVHPRDQYDAGHLPE